MEETETNHLLLYYFSSLTWHTDRKVIVIYEFWMQHFVEPVAETTAPHSLVHFIFRYSITELQDLLYLTEYKMHVHTFLRRWKLRYLPVSKMEDWNKNSLKSDNILKRVTFDVPKIMVCWWLNESQFYAIVFWVTMWDLQSARNSYN